jgi:hypothetical protein
VEISAGLVVQIVVGVLGVVGSWVTVAYFAGRLTRAQEDTQKTVDTHTTTLAEHAAMLTDHNGQLIRLDEWKNGFAVASQLRCSGSQEERK